MHNSHAVTAIASATFESLVAKSLYENGWDVEHRVLDARDIPEQGDYLLLLSLDLEGLTQEILDKVTDSFEKVLVFSPNPHNFFTRLDIYEPSNDSHQVLSIIRGHHRQPLKQENRQVLRKRAQLHYFFSARAGVGCSTVAANVALELSQKERKVLLIDGDLHFPSLFYYLGARNLDEPQSITPHLSVVELGSRNSTHLISDLDRWMADYDDLVLDGGPLPSTLELSGDRRLAGVITTWALDFSCKNYVVTTDREIDSYPTTQLLEKLKSFKSRAEFIRLRNMVERVPRGERNPSEYLLPRDSRNLLKCEREKLLLSEAAGRSPLAKALSQFVTEALM